MNLLQGINYAEKGHELKEEGAIGGTNPEAGDITDRPHQRGWKEDTPAGNEFAALYKLAYDENQAMTDTENVPCQV